MLGESGTQLAASLLAGGVAGTAVDIVLFPLDTIRTRLQSQQGLWAAGGFRSIYSGLTAAALGSAPTAALFFFTYEFVKVSFCKAFGERWSPASHMAAASLGEVVACVIRVPVEVIKQRTQSLPNATSLSIFRQTIHAEGFNGLYRGYVSTVFREIPFSFFQFPLWEYLKVRWSSWQKMPVDPWQSSLCGALSGGIAAGLTTPLDVAKTRIMLAETGSSLSKGNIVNAFYIVFHQNGMKGLFAGIVPRVVWTSFGGAIFLGIYDKTKSIIMKNS